MPLLGLPASRADEEVSTGGTVTGEFVQMRQEFDDPRDADAPADGALLSFVRTEAGKSVRVATDEVEALPVGATVELTVGDLAAVARGSHRVCAYAIDTEGRGSVLLGCRTVTAQRSSFTPRRRRRSCR
ncbi:MAG: hypothetical protein ABWY29_13470 [Blastococcus sp.]